MGQLDHNAKRVTPLRFPRSAACRHVLFGRSSLLPRQELLAFPSLQRASFHMLPSQAPKVPPPPQCPSVRPFIASFSVLRCRSPVGCSFAQVLRFFSCAMHPCLPSDPIFVIIVITIPSVRLFLCFRIDSLELATARFCVFHSISFCPPQSVPRPSVLPCSRPHHLSNIFSHLPRPRTFPLSHNASIPSATFAPLRRRYHHCPIVVIIYDRLSLPVSHTPFPSSLIP